ncbi:FAD-binding oxidoreductase [Mucilaginibacter sp. SMC90]|uniref:FAD-binding oxidoreductase n=1 Tax=Mucilaginibacter sp. SMC90 TaxID=2929803 RepID=UPI001FB1AB85|nr:FAD-binding oxidoreductase [Mucilaginibacter sp. SMC90]UOE48245.1 FAD-binding oxidoreductase [Mucilaginibacter sp. SMC90]
MEQIVKILAANYVTHNVRRFRLEKPAGYSFIPGQATELSINIDGWRDETRPFTFTSLNDDDYLEFTIKTYTDHDGVTNQLSKVKEGDELIIRDVWGAIEYKGAGYFIAGGAGITPFLAILRQLNKDGAIGDNRLIFSNKTDKDIILSDELKSMLGANAHFIITDQKDSMYDQRHINAEFLKAEIKDFSKHFYICGPDAMVTELSGILGQLGADSDSVVFER